MWTIWPINQPEDYMSRDWSFYSLVYTFPKRCTLNNKAVGTVRRASSNPPKRIQSRDSFFLIFFFQSVNLFQWQKYISTMLKQNRYWSPLFSLFFWGGVAYQNFSISSEGWIPAPDENSWFRACSVLLRRIIYKKSRWMPFWLHGCCGKYEGWNHEPGNHTSQMLL